jgi:hypothetical protein
MYIVCYLFTPYFEVCFQSCYIETLCITLQKKSNDNFLQTSNVSQVLNDYDHTKVVHCIGNCAFLVATQSAYVRLSGMPSRENPRLLSSKDNRCKIQREITISFMLIRMQWRT